MENQVSEIRRLIPANTGDTALVQRIRLIYLLVVSIPTEFQEKLDFWLCGPSWLISGEGHVTAVHNDMLQECLQEMQSKDKALTSLLVSIGPTDVIGINRYGCLRRLLRVTAQVLRFVRILKSRVQAEDGLSAEDMKSALIRLIRVSQPALPEKRMFPVWRKQFSLFKAATGAWKCRGRLANMDVLLSARFPILLDKEEALT